MGKDVTVLLPSPQLHLPCLFFSNAWDIRACTPSPAQPACKHWQRARCCLLPRPPPHTQVKDLWRNLAAKTVGIARVDLRRPT